jgi:hypothetical protein
MYGNQKTQAIQLLGFCYMMFDILLAFQTCFHKFRVHTRDVF